jgi:hypothetical protein
MGSSAGTFDSRPASRRRTAIRGQGGHVRGCASAFRRSSSTVERDG